MSESENVAQPITLSSMLEGRLEEMFQREVERVTSNINDPNTDPEAKRTITLTIDIFPIADGGSCVVKAGVTSKLPGIEKKQGSLVFYKGKAYAYDNKQTQLFGLEKEPENVMTMKSAAESGEK